MRFYRLLSLLPRPRSYIGKILFVSFVGVHIPLLALIFYLLLLSDLAIETVAPVVVVLLVATVGGTVATFAALYALLAPVRAASAAVRDYLATGVLPRLPAGSADDADAAARLMADVQEGLTRLDVALAAATAAAESTVSDKRELFGALSKLSHDLRTPLNAIVGFSQMIHHEMLGPIGAKAYRGYARDIETSGQQLLGRIQHILDLSQVEAGDVSPTREVVSISRVVDESVRAKHLHAGAAGLVLSAAETPPLSVHTDHSALVQAVMNLISVAVETTPAEGKVTVSAAEGEGSVVISIADTGRPLGPADVPAGLVDRGDVAARNSTSVPDGIGDATSVTISLILADRVAALCGATLRWHYVEGRGKLFRLTLPSLTPDLAASGRAA